MLRIFIVDSIGVIRSALRELLSEHWQNVFFDEADSLRTATDRLGHIPAEEYALIIFGSNLPDGSAANLLKKIRRAYPVVKCMILADHLDYPEAIACLNAGAAGYLTKSAGNEEIRTAVDAVLGNEMYLCHDLVREIVKEKLRSFDGNARLLPVKFLNSYPTLKIFALSERETEIAQHLILGRSTTTIAKTLNLKMSTVSTHKAHIFQKLGAKNLVELVRIMSGMSS
jgi:DNA-binding NarL/FixJ family response regulator